MACPARHGVATLNNMAATEDAEPSASGGVSAAAAANKVPPIFAQRDAYVAGGNIIFNGPPPGEGQPKVRDQPVGPFAAPWIDLMMHGTSTQVAVSTAIPAVAVARGSRCSIVHFTSGGYRTSSLPLARSEFLVPASAERFASHDGRRLVVRDFADGTVVWEQPCPRSVATAAIDAGGATVAMAGSSSRFTPSNQFIVTSKDDLRPHEFTFENIGVPGAGCQLGLSPGGELVVCASFREILLARPGTGEIVRRRPISGVREELAPALGLRPQRLICTSEGQVLWLRGRRVVDANWSALKFRYLPQDGLCDDIALDHVNSRLAMVGASGQVDVFEWYRP